MGNPSAWKLVVGVHMITVKIFVMKIHKGPQTLWMNNKNLRKLT
jgi:hypothetical protein